MNAKTSLEAMTVIFSIEKAESTLRNLIERDIIVSNNENYNILKNVLVELQFLKEKVNNV